MQQLAEQKPTAVSVPPENFVDRRQVPSSQRDDGPERRQFQDRRTESRPEVVELAEAIDQYKLRHRRRFITFEELFDVIEGLGYQKTS